MEKKNLFLNDFLKLFAILEFKEKIKVYFCIFAMIISSFFEVLSIGALIPFVTAILSPEKLFKMQYIELFIHEENFENHNLQLIFTIGFIISIIVANSLRIFVLYLATKISKTIPLSLASKIYEKTIKSSYNDIKGINSSKIVSVITDKMDAISGVFFNYLSACTAILISAGVLSFLFYLNVQITFISIIIALSLYLIITFSIKKRLKKNSVILSTSSAARVKHVKETFGAIKQIILNNSEKLFSNFFYNHDKDFRITQFKSQFFMTFPRFIVEAVGIVSISILVYLFYKVYNLEPTYIITLVGALAFAAQKLLPLINTIFICYSSLINSSNFIQEVNEILYDIDNREESENNNIKKDLKLDFNQKITFKDISYKYKRTNNDIIKSISFDLDKGSKIGIIGPTGSGKSTLLDILMGLLDPIDGDLLIDNQKLTEKNKRLWQSKISHVPQDIYLFDASIKENIIFNIFNVEQDLNKIIESAKLAEIHDFISTLPQKYDTIVGENGILLSGGQKQRIGIARALFRDKEILTLDEATSALDIETEKKILENINRKQKTIIQITHRVNELDGYDKIIKL